jgi:hypothetical protein
VALLTNPGVKEASKFHPLRLFSGQDWRFVEFVAIRTDGSVSIRRKNSKPVDALGIAVILMTDGTPLNDPDLISLPGGNLVDLDVAVLTLDIIDKVRAGVVLYALDFVTAMARHRIGLNPGPRRRMFLKIGNVPVTAITRIGTVNRLDKSLLVNFFMAFETRRVVDALETELPVTDFQPFLDCFELLFEAKDLATAWCNR